MRILLLLSICWLALGAARAQDIVAPPIDAPILSPDEKRLLEDRSKALHEKADLMRQEAETKFAEENSACWQKFLVSSCQKDAKKTKNERLVEARRVEQEAKEIDRKLRTSNFAEHQRTKEAEAPQKAADAAEQAEKNRKEREEAMARVEKNKQEAAQRGKH
jgi:hypothetical protein